MGKKTVEIRLLVDDDTDASELTGRFFGVVPYRPTMFGDVYGAVDLMTDGSGVPTGKIRTQQGVTWDGNPQETV